MAEAKFHPRFVKLEATRNMFYHRGSPKDGDVKWINHANTDSESKPDQPDGQENVHTCKHLDEMKTNLYEYKKSEQGKCLECRPPLSSTSGGIYICLLCGKQACKNHFRDDYECSVVHRINTKTVWCQKCKIEYTPEIGETLFERYYTECEHLKEPLFSNEEGQLVKFKVKALMQICGKCLPNLPKKNILICLICGIKICCVEKAKQHNLVFYTHRLSLEISANTVYCHTCQKEFSHDEYSTVSIHGEYIKEQCEIALQQLSNHSVVDVTDYHDKKNEDPHQLPPNQLNLEQQVNELTQECDQLREGYNQLQQQIDQLSQERDQAKERCSQLEQQVNERCHELEKQANELSQQYAELKQMYDELENLKNQLSEKNNSLMEQLKENTEKAQQRETQYKQQLKEAQQRETQYKQQLKEAQQRETQYKQQLKEDSEVMAEMHQQLNQMQDSLYNYRQQLDQKNSLIKTSQVRYQTLENKLHEADTQNDILKKQNDNLQLENMKLKREISELSVTLNEMHLSTRQKDDELSKLRLQLKQQFQHKPAATFKSDVPRKHLFLAVLDYFPESFCKSGHPEQELQLKAGDIVNVIGDMNSDGYYRVKFNDRQGLVPAHFLEEMNIKNSAIKRRLRNQSLSSITRYSSGDVRRSLSESDTDADSNRRVSCDSSDDEVFLLQSVAPPIKLRVESASQNGLTISWMLPNITTLSDCNGIKGYLVFLNNIPRFLAPGCYVTKALIKNINIDKPHVIAVATLTVNGTLSSICQTSYKPKHISHDHHITMTRSSHSHQPSHSLHHQSMNVMQSSKPMSGQQRSQEDDVI